MKITRYLLEKMHSGERACEFGLIWFADNFPDGGEIEEVWKKCYNEIWKIWFACNYLQGDKLAKLAFKFAGQAMRFAEIAEWADNIHSEEDCENAARAADAARAARYAHYADAARYAANAARYAANAANAASRYNVNTAANAILNAADDAVDVSIDVGNSNDITRREQSAWCREALGF